jgi:hypothetical protein
LHPPQGNHPSKTTFFPLSFFLKSKQNSSLDGQDWDTTSYELQQGAGEASDWQDRESEKLKPPGSKHLAGVFVTKGGWGFLKNGFFFFSRTGFFHIWSKRLFFNFISVSVCWDYIKEIQGTILPSLATLPAEAPTRS